MRAPPQGLKVEPSLKAWLNEAANAISELQHPTFPHPAYACATTALPPAASFPNCVVDLTDLNTLGKSDGTNWYRVDTGATVP